jgi:hypothetical protein
MNNQEKYNDDLLRKYISPEKIEKAPEGFTSRVMMDIQIDTIPSTVAGRSQKKNLVPVISAVVIILLIATAFLIPGSESDSLTSQVLNIFRNTKFSLPEIDLSSFFRLNLPSVMIYVCIGVLLLTGFDRALYGIFHRGK